MSLSFSRGGSGDYCGNSIVRARTHARYILRSLARTRLYVYIGNAGVCIYAYICVRVVCVSLRRARSLASIRALSDVCSRNALLTIQCTPSRATDCTTSPSAPTAV